MSDDGGATTFKDASAGPRHPETLLYDISPARIGGTRSVPQHVPERRAENEDVGPKRHHLQGLHEHSDPQRHRREPRQLVAQSAHRRDVRSGFVQRQLLAAAGEGSAHGGVEHKRVRHTEF